MLAATLAGDVREPNTSNASSMLFPVPLDVPFVAGDWKGSYDGGPPAGGGAMEGLPQGDDCACDEGVTHGSLLGMADRRKQYWDIHQSSTDTTHRQMQMW